MESGRRVTGGCSQRWNRKKTAGRVTVGLSVDSAPLVKNARAHNILQTVSSSSENPQKLPQHPTVNNSINSKPTGMWNQDTRETGNGFNTNTTVPSKTAWLPKIILLQRREMGLLLNPVPNPGINSPLSHFIFFRDRLLRIRPFFKKFLNVNIILNFFVASNSIISCGNKNNLCLSALQGSCSKCGNSFHLA